MKYYLIVVLVLLQLIACSQKAPVMDFEKYEPRSTLVVPEHHVKHAKFPFIDIHNHQWEMDTQDLSGLVKEMDSLNMAVMNNLSGRSYKDRNGFFDIQDTNYLHTEMNNIRKHYPSRFTIFTNISFWKFGEPGWSGRALSELETDVRNGASGLKIYKDLGMEFRDEKGKRIAVDDPRLDPIWEKCGELKIPVLIHSADPSSFWDREDEYNERWLELKTHPDRKKENNDPAPWAQIIREQHHMFQKHPHTIFIAAHMGWLGNNLAELGRLLDSLPNVYVEIAAVIAELEDSRGWQESFLTNTRTGYCLERIHGFLRNTRLTSGCWRRRMNIFPIIKNITHSGGCTDSGCLTAF